MTQVFDRIQNTNKNRTLSHTFLQLILALKMLTADRLLVMRDTKTRLKA